MTKMILVPTGLGFRTEIPNPGGSTSGENKRLRELAGAGLRRLIPPGDERWPVYSRRLERELADFESAALAPFLLRLHAVAVFARQNRIIAAPGRGAAPSSLVLYALGLTGVDPVAHGLVFARFFDRPRAKRLELQLDFQPGRLAEVREFACRQFACDPGELERPAAGLDGELGFALELLSKCCDREPGGKVHASPVEVSLAVMKLFQAADTRDIPFFRSRRMRAMLRETVPQNLNDLVCLLALDRPGLERAYRAFANRRNPEDPARRREAGAADTPVGSPVSSPERSPAQFPRQILAQIADRSAPGRISGCVSERLPECLPERPSECLPECPSESLLECIPERFFKTDSDSILERFPDSSNILGESRGVLLFQEQLVRLATRITGRDQSWANAFRRALARRDGRLLPEFRRQLFQSEMSPKYEKRELETLLELLFEAAPLLFPKAQAAAWVSLALESAHLKAAHRLRYQLATKEFAPRSSGNSE